MVGILASLIYLGASADKALLTPATLSDFVTARQLRNLTLNGQKEIAPIDGRYYRAPLVNLLQSAQPSVLAFRQLFFKHCDGIILKGDAKGMVKFPDIVISDCSFVKANQHPIHIHGPIQKEALIDAIMGPGNVDDQ